MPDQMLAVIPARGGSKRIPRKNIKDFMGKPLIAYSIIAAVDSELFSDIIVSTDDEEIAATAKKYGASVPFLRDPTLSDDFTGTGPVAADAYNRMVAMGRSYSGVCTIYATAPLLTADHLSAAYDRFSADKADYLFSCCEFPFPFQRGFFMNADGSPAAIMPECQNMRSQDLPKAYQDAGQFYFKSVDFTLYEGLSPQEQSKMPRPAFVERLYEMPRYRVIDIDTPEDWEYAVILAEAVHRLNKP